MVIISKQTKALLLLTMWIGTVVGLFAGFMFTPTLESFPRIALGLVSALGLGTVAVIFWPMIREYPPGHCEHCGYDLTKNVSGRCPECGTDLASTAAHSRSNGAARSQ